MKFSSEKVRTEFFYPEKGRRILVVSDIHTNIDYFEKLLEKVDFNSEDYLIIDGDFLEKGRRNLEMLRFMKDFSKRDNVKIVLGNCDDWYRMFSISDERCDYTLNNYVRYFRRGILWEMCSDCGVDVDKLESFSLIRDKLRSNYIDEWTFLESLPHAIETDNFIFAHGGMNPEKALNENSSDELTHTNALLKTDYSFDKWLVVGHWPVVLYGENKVCANPIINRERHIISIDGGCVLKDDGQLNCLIIPDKDSEDFSWVYYDPFPTARVLSSQKESGHSYYIRWGDSEVQVLDRGEEFSHCRHVRTGYEMDILTKYLFTSEEITKTNDCTDYVLPLKAGDEVSIIENTSRGYFVKHNGVSGWYYGELQ